MYALEAPDTGGDNRCYSNIVSNGSQKIRVAEFNGKLLELTAA